jgi:hypothetical protein
MSKVKWSVMRISDMTPEQRREYNKSAKRKQRNQQKAEVLRRIIPRAKDFHMPDLDRRNVEAYSAQIVTAIQTELAQGKLSERDEYIVDAVACVMSGFENDFVQVVHDPSGMLVGGHFPDAVGADAVEYVHRFPELMKSKTFNELYNRFLREVVKWAKKNQQYVDAEFIQQMKAELVGTYQLSPLRDIPKPDKPMEEPLPSMAEILERGRIELLRRIYHDAQSPHARVHDPNMAPDARRYLDGL